ncbi:MAG: ABC transporter permease [Flavobacteriaceae bacterium]
MFKIVTYVLKDLFRAHWIYAYLGFYLILGFALLFLNRDLSKAVLTLMNIILIISPLMGTLFGIMYYYNSREFTHLLLSLPLKRSSIFFGLYLGVCLSLSISMVVGLSLPFLVFKLFEGEGVEGFFTLLSLGVCLTCIFNGLVTNIALRNENRIKGFGYALLMWLMLALIYDAALLLIFLYFSDYPLENFSLVVSLLNPIDLARILMLIQLDITALMGYTGAVFKQFFGSYYGVTVAIGVMWCWMVFPLFLIHKILKKKDF